MFSTARVRRLSTSSAGLHWSVGPGDRVVGSPRSARSGWGQLEGTWFVLLALAGYDDPEVRLRAGLLPRCFLHDLETVKVYATKSN